MSTYRVVTSNSLQHSWAGSDKKYTAEEKAKEKKYNHEYCMKNKEKWGIKQEGYTKGDSDFDDDANYDEKNRIGGSDFFAFKNKDGKWVITEEDMKWVLPEGVEPDAEMRKQLAAFKGFQDSNIKTREDWDEAVASIINKGKKQSGSGEFDIDAAAMDVIRGKYKNGQERRDELGEDYEAVQRRVNELMKEMSKTSSTKKKSDTSKNLRDMGYPSSTDGMKKSTAKHSYTVVTEDELYHHGIIGQKWGVRRYQNSDGSLTSEGRQRYGGKSSITQQETNTVLNEAGKITRSTSDASKSINKIKKSEEAKKKEKEKTEEDAPKKVEEMSDKELREFLNRYDMEQRYYKIQNKDKEDILTGQEKVQEILEVTKDFAAIAVSAATIYAILHGKK